MTSDKTPTTSELANASQALVDQIVPLLHGQGPAMQGAALADLVAMYFAAHHPALREAAITMWLGTMRKLIAINAAMLRERLGNEMPEGWEKQ